MKIINFNQRDPELLKTIIDKISSRRFLVISFKDGGGTEDHWYYVNNEEALAYMEVLKHKIIREFNE